MCESSPTSVHVTILTYDNTALCRERIMLPSQRFQPSRFGRKPPVFGEYLYAKTNIKKNKQTKI